MKKKLPYALAGLILLCLLCTACGGDPSLQDDPNDGLGQRGYRERLQRF